MLKKIRRMSQLQVQMKSVRINQGSFMVRVAGASGRIERWLRRVL